jgi:radical SAM superfamily enzyme YgiQ (UPF0313 family)
MNENNMMHRWSPHGGNQDVCLIWPPAYYPWQVAPGLAYLAGYLESHGIAVRVVDANVQALERVLSDACAERERVRAALGALRDRRSVLSWQRYQHAMRFLGELARSVSQERPEEIRFERNSFRYYPSFELRSRAGLLAAAEASDQHLFSPYFRDTLIPELRRSKHTVIGISASDLHQLLPATVLAATLRHELQSECPRLVFGGNVFARIHEVLTRPDEINEKLFDIWGTVIVGEGERALLQFVQALLAGEKDIAIEGVIRPGSGPPAKTGAIDLNELPTPRCEGFEPLSPEISVPLNLYRGCYMSGACGFCDINQGYDTIWTQKTPALLRANRRLRRVDRVVEDIRKSVTRYGTHLFSFTDEWFRTNEMLELADRLVEERLFVAWDAYTRLEKRLLEPGVAERLSRGGARFLQFGLETASVESLASIGKSTDPQVAAEILHVLSKAGIWNHVFVIVGLPGETLHDGLITAGFLLQNAEHIFTIKPTRYQLSRHSPFAVGKRFAAIAVNEDRARELDIALNLPFRYEPISYCARCRERRTVIEGMHCPVCRDRLVTRPSVSRRAVNAMYTAMELLAARHWAYPFTSLYPYHVRLLFSAGEARSIANERRADTDRNLGLSENEIRELMAGLGRQLEWEATHLGSVRRVYRELHLDHFFQWNDIEDFFAAARRWSSAAFSFSEEHQKELVILQ